MMSVFDFPPEGWADHAGVATATLENFVDLDRVCPAVAGVGFIAGDTLKLRMASGDLRIKAPRRLLARVFEKCDGTRSWNEIVDSLPEAQRPEFSSFLRFLFDQGALVDAIHLTLHASAWAAQTIPVGMEAASKVTDRIGLRPRPASTGPDEASFHEVSGSPLQHLVDGRSGAYTFSGSAIEEERLLTFLWSLGGIVSDFHPKVGPAFPQRVVPSAGAMYLVKWILVLRLPSGRYGPGIYLINYPGENKISLQPISDDIGLFYRAFLKPWQLTFAAGAVFGVADAMVGALRYRNRALQYLFIEAGCSLQNLALAGPELGISCSIIGGYCEETVRRLCRLTSETIVSAGVFGGNPSKEELAQIKSMPPIDFVWSDVKSDVYPLGFSIARARVRGQSSKEFDTWGKDRDPWLAYVKAHAETIERQGIREPKNVKLARQADLDAFVSPEELCRYQPSQFQQPSFPYVPYDPALPAVWVEAVDALSGRAVHVPSDFIHSRRALPDLVGSEDLPGLSLQANSSGCAAGRTLESSQTSALLEVIERDAFMRHWLRQQPGAEIRMDELPASVQSRVRTLQSAGCEVAVQLLESVAARVCLVSATNHDQHFTCVGASCRFAVDEAVDGALDELETMVYTRLSKLEFDPLKPGDVVDPAGHTLLYAQSRYYRMADNVLRPRSHASSTAALPHKPSLDGLIGQLRSQGRRIIFADLTPKQHSLDQGRTPLSVVKAMVPGLIPISFGYGREPRGMVANCDRRSFVPHPFP